MNPNILRQELEYNQETGEFYRKIARGGQQVGDKAGYINKSRSYVMIDVCGKTYTAHRLAFLYLYDRWPIEIDHIDRNPINNRISNLREVTRSENLQNAKVRIDNTSGHKGVYFFKRTGKWMACVSLKGKQVHLGFFLTKEAAISARQEGEMKYYGSFC